MTDKKQKYSLVAMSLMLATGLTATQTAAAADPAATAQVVKADAKKLVAEAVCKDSASEANKNVTLANLGDSCNQAHQKRDFVNLTSPVKPASNGEVVLKSAYVPSKYSAQIVNVDNATKGVTGSNIKSVADLLKGNANISLDNVTAPSVHVPEFPVHVTGVDATAPATLTSSSTELVNKTYIPVADLNSTPTTTNSTPVTTNATNVTPTTVNATPVVSNATPVVSNATPVVTNATKVVTNATKVVTNATKVVSNATKVVSNATKVAANATPAVNATKVVTEVVNASKAAVNSTLVAVANATADAKAALTNATNTVKAVVSNATAAASNATNAVVNATKTVVAEVKEKVKEAVEEVKPSAKVVKVNATNAKEVNIVAAVNDIVKTLNVSINGKANFSRDITLAAPAYVYKPVVQSTANTTTVNSTVVNTTVANATTANTSVVNSTPATTNTTNATVVNASAPAVANSTVVTTNTSVAVAKAEEVKSTVEQALVEAKGDIGKLLESYGSYRGAQEVVVTGNNLTSTEVYNSTVSAVKDAVTKVKEETKDVVNATVDLTKQVVNASKQVAAKAEELGDKVADKAKELSEKAVEAGKALVADGKQVLANAANATSDAVAVAKNFVANATKAVANATTNVANNVTVTANSTPSTAPVVNATKVATNAVNATPSATPVTVNATKVVNNATSVPANATRVPANATNVPTNVTVTTSNATVTPAAPAPKAVEYTLKDYPKTQGTVNPETKGTNPELGGNNNDFNFNPNPTAPSFSSQVYVTGVFTNKEDIAKSAQANLPASPKTVLAEITEDLLNPQALLTKYRQVLTSLEYATKDANYQLANLALLFAFNSDRDQYVSNSVNVFEFRSKGVPVSPPNLHGFWPNPRPSQRNFVESGAFALNNANPNILNPFAPLLTNYQPTLDKFGKFINEAATSSAVLPPPLDGLSYVHVRPANAPKVEVHDLTISKFGPKEKPLTPEQLRQRPAYVPVPTELKYTPKKVETCPVEDKPTEGKPADKPAESKPADKPADSKPAPKKADAKPECTPAKPAADKPADKPAETPKK